MGPAGPPNPNIIDALVASQVPVRSRAVNPAAVRVVGTTVKMLSGRRGERESSKSCPRSRQRGGWEQGHPCCDVPACVLGAATCSPLVPFGCPPPPQEDILELEKVPKRATKMTTFLTRDTIWGFLAWGKR